MLSLAPALSRTAGASLLVFAASTQLHSESPWAILWTAPLLLLASLLIAWGAESAQYFIAQGFALAILALLQTLPEFAVEAVLAWRQQKPLLLSNLTGALRLLTGVGWPLIYATAAIYHRVREKKPLRRVVLEPHDSVQVVTLVVSLVWIAVVYFKRSLSVVDAVILIAVYVLYLWLLNRIPPEEAEDVEEMERIPRTIVKAAPAVRNVVITALFIIGGGLMFVIAEPFLGALLAVATTVGISQFVAVQWVAPFVSEFPEKVSAFYWARTVTKAPIALMNMVSSNINQWTLLAGMLPLVLSLGSGRFESINFDHQQSVELLMTAAQSLLGALLLFDMGLVWWEALVLFVLWAVQFGFSVAPTGTSNAVHEIITVIYLIWCGVEVLRILFRKRIPEVFREFRAVVWNPAKD